MTLKILKLLLSYQATKQFFIKAVYINHSKKRLNNAVCSQWLKNCIKNNKVFYKKVLCIVSIFDTIVKRT